MPASSYLYSHMAAGKGLAYDKSYETDHLHQYFWQREQFILDRILAEFFADTPIDLLDFACGTGRITSALENKVQTATGVDVSEAMLEVARQKLHRTKLYKGNLLQEPLFPDRKFNLITAFRFFVNAEPELRLAALRALEPLLARDGYFVFNNHQNLNASYIRLALVYARRRGFQLDNVLSIAQCRELFASVGLEIVRIYAVGILHLPKIKLPHSLYRLADRLVGSSKMLAPHSESPILVARRSIHR